MELLAYAAFFLTVAMTYATICLGLNVQWGQTGLFNVGVAAFVGLGAYVSAILTTPEAPGRLGGLGLPIAAGWVGAALAGGVLALLVGALTIRLRSDYLAIATFGVAVALQLVFQNAEPLTGGAFGIGFIPRPFGGLQRQALPFAALNLALTVALVLILYLALERLAQSPWGRALRAVREDETAAESLGKSPLRLRLEAFVLGGMVMALAGAVQAHFIGFIAPANYLPALTFQVWAMLILGGSGNNRGAILGAVVVWAIWAATAALIAHLVPAGEQARASSLQLVAIGVILCAVLLWRPQGLLPERRAVPRHLGRP
ncbi:Branched-chain amino acid transport system permease protein LivM [Rubellimicrobium mesophilum DSM 19309]|uniref:Branched-chain amino acid transport system permease protein LivM n=1 Tax=Rubellimicrobium mesophilum DSM 19309 TaxID=442562 RepID=A0A017HP23_9RHOB|nr:branched-chain amino acid ABC transporter permease [Rubellimicrobium mesophilum]EYD76030.1 Branched-chain amino acid transport system permease protein LivM [Rubellimicrobium mesophilum DSM 19309]